MSFHIQLSYVLAADAANMDVVMSAMWQILTVSLFIKEVSHLLFFLPVFSLFPLSSSFLPFSSFFFSMSSLSLFSLLPYSMTLVP